MNRTTILAAAAALTPLALAASDARAQTAVLTGNDDFSISNVGEGFFGVTRRDAVNSRFQVNGRNPASTDRNFGLWATFDIPTAGVFPSDISTLESARIDLFQAQPITGQDVDNVITGGTMNVYLTLENADVLDSSNGFDWIDSDPEGLGSQFADRVLVGTVDLADGNTDVSFDLPLDTVGSTIINELNNGDFLRFVFTTPDMDFATSWGVGAPGTSDILAFDGAAPTVTFTVPAPGGALLAGIAGLAAIRRKR